MTMTRKIPFIFLIGLLALTGLSACSSGAHLNMMPMEEMSPEVLASPMIVQSSYRFAAANPDIMKDIPCYCGCDSLGHTSNYDCYVSSVNADGSITFEEHGLNCLTCVNITQDVMKILREGKSPGEARDYVNATYGKYSTTQTP